MIAPPHGAPAGAPAAHSSTLCCATTLLSVESTPCTNTTDHGRWTTDPRPFQNNSFTPATGAHARARPSLTDFIYRQDGKDAQDGPQLLRPAALPPPEPPAIHKHRNRRGTPGTNTTDDGPRTPSQFTNTSSKRRSKSLQMCVCRHSRLLRLLPSNHWTCADCRSRPHHSFTNTPPLPTLSPLPSAPHSITRKLRLRAHAQESCEVARVALRRPRTPPFPCASCPTPSSKLPGSRRRTTNAARIPVLPKMRGLHASNQRNIRRRRMIGVQQLRCELAVVRSQLSVATEYGAMLSAPRTTDHGRRTLR